MGYLLPVNNYQYQDYQRRVTRTKQDPFYIEKPYRTQLETSYYKTAGNQISALTDDYSDALRLTAPPQPSEEKIYAALTGKGRYYSRLI